MAFLDLDETKAVAAPKMEDVFWTYDAKVKTKK